MGNPCVHVELTAPDTGKGRPAGATIGLWQSKVK